MSLAGANSFVLFPMGAKRFALPARQVAELARPDRLQVFPHTTPLMSGVLVRRGNIIPVCDVAQILVGPEAPPRKFYLIAIRKSSSGTGTPDRDWIAIPVTGECELVSGVMMLPTDEAADYVAGVLLVGIGRFEVVDIEKVIAGGAQAGQSKRGPAEVSS